MPTIDASGTALCQANATLRNWDSIVFQLTCYDSASFRSSFGDYGGIALLPEEDRMLRPFEYPAIEECRRVTLQNILSGSEDLIARVRAITITALSTELRSFVLGLLPAAATLNTNIFKRKGTEVDVALRALVLVQEVAMSELGLLGTPKQHQEMLRTRLRSNSFNHRVSAMCTMVLLASILIYQEETAIP